MFSSSCRCFDLCLQYLHPLQTGFMYTFMNIITLEASAHSLESPPRTYFKIMAVISTSCIEIHCFSKKTVLCIHNVKSAPFLIKIIFYFAYLWIDLNFSIAAEFHGFMSCCTIRALNTGRHVSWETVGSSLSLHDSPSARCPTSGAGTPGRVQCIVPTAAVWLLTAL